MAQQPISLAGLDPRLLQSMAGAQVSPEQPMSLAANSPQAVPMSVQQLMQLKAERMMMENQQYHRSQPQPQTNQRPMATYKI